MKPEKSAFEKYLVNAIKLTGPMTVATYMREILTNAKYGYYMNRDVFGTKGDFTTSPEISQMFGELVAVWIVSVWEQMGKPKTLQLVELGPGRGTLMSDIVARQFPEFYNAINVQLVEVSPALRGIQATNLGGTYDDANPVTQIKGPDGKPGPKLNWQLLFDDVPEVPSIIIAHEFYDCLPVFHFQMTRHGWLDRLIDIDPTTSSNHLRFVLAPGPTVASKAFTKDMQGKEGDVLEVCPEGVVLSEKIGKRIAKVGGAALIMDYGENNPMGATLRAIKNHKFYDVFHDPGQCDLSALVDFSAIRNAVKNIPGVQAYGAVDQGEFLQEMGIATRLSVLIQSVAHLPNGKEKAQAMVDSVKRLVLKSEMGSTYKAIALVDSKIPTPYGFLGSPQHKEKESKETAAQ